MREGLFEAVQRVYGALFPEGHADASGPLFGKVIQEGHASSKLLDNWLILVARGDTVPAHAPPFHFIGNNRYAV